MKKIIQDNFNGYVKYRDWTFTYNVSKSLVTLLPAYSNLADCSDVWSKIKINNNEDVELLFGIHDLYRVAFLKNNRFSMSIFGHDLSIKFATPMIIEATGNASGYYSKFTEPFEKFHAITFVGGNINSIYLPQNAIDYNTSSLKPYEEFSETINCKIFGENVLFTIGICFQGDGSTIGHPASYKLGELDSYIRLQFEQSKAFYDIKKYYFVIKSLVSLLTGQKNVYFDDIYLSQRTSDKLYFKTATCKIFDLCENYAQKTSLKVIGITDIFEEIPHILSLIANNEIICLLDILPNDNRVINRISISNIQGICTALEIVYGWTKEKRIKDKNIIELKSQIKETINDYLKNHVDLDIYKKTTISSAFNYLDYTLADKIYTLCEENREIVDKLTIKYNTPKADIQNIGDFVKLRNSKTHNGVFEWNDAAYLYNIFLALIYISVFKRINLSEERISDIIFSRF